MDNYYGPLTPKLREWHEEAARIGRENAIRRADEAIQAYKKWKAETPLLKRLYQKINDPFVLFEYGKLSLGDMPFFFHRQRFLESNIERNLRNVLHGLAMHLGDVKLYRATANRLPGDMSREDAERQMQFNFALYEGGPRAAYFEEKKQHILSLTEIVAKFARNLGNSAKADGFYNILRTKGYL